MSAAMLCRMGRCRHRRAAGGPDGAGGVEVVVARRGSVTPQASSRHAARRRRARCPMGRSPVCRARPRRARARAAARRARPAVAQGFPGWVLRRRCGRCHRCLAPLGRELQVAAGDGAATAGALHRGQVDAQLVGAVPQNGRDRRHGALLPGRHRHGRRRHGRCCGGHPGRGWRREEVGGGRHGGGGAAVEPGEQAAHRHDIALLRHELAHDAVLEALDLHGRLRRLDHGDDVATVHGVTGRDQPLDDGALAPCPRRGRAWGSHPSPPTVRRAAATMSSGCGRAACSRCRA